MKKIILSISICLLLLNIISCGYTFQGSGSVLPAVIKTVYIEDVKNNTTESGLGNILTESLKDRFDRYGTLRVVTKLEEADSILRTTILSVERDTSTVTASTDVALQLETVMKVSSELKTKTGQLLWTTPIMRISRIFGTASDAVVTSSAGFASSGLNQSDLANLNQREIARGQEGEVLEDMCEELAKKIYESAVLPEF